MTTITKAAQDVLAERARQVNAEGWTPEHDDEHDDGSLAMAAACYAAPMAKKGKTEQVDVSGGRGECPVWRSKWFSVPFLWPDSWHAEWWKPGREADLSVDGLGPVSRVPDRRRDLVRAAALLLAEIERLDRASGVGVMGDGTGEALPPVSNEERAAPGAEAHRWISLAERKPEPGALIVKRWKSGSVWAGVYSGSDKDSSFDEWVALPDGVKGDGRG